MKDGKVRIGLKKPESGVEQLAPTSEYAEIERTIEIRDLEGEIVGTLAIELDFEGDKCWLVMISPEKCLFRLKSCDLAMVEMVMGVPIRGEIGKILTEHGTKFIMVDGTLPRTVIRGVIASRLLDWLVGERVVA